jgi:hypothetical protein
MPFMFEGIFVLSPVGELDTVISQNSMDATGHGRDQITQELAVTAFVALGCSSA